MEKIEEVKEERGKAEGNFNVQNDATFTLQSFFHTWTLGNISKCLNFEDASVYSPVFEFENTTWRFLMHVISKDHQLKEITIRPCTVATSKYGNSHYLRYKISICDDNRGPLATKTAECRLEKEKGNLCHRLTFKFDGDEKEALKSVLENDKLIFHCEFLVLSAISCDQKNVKQVPPKNPVKKNVKPWMLFTPTKTLPVNPRYLTANQVNRARNKAEQLHLFLFIVLAVPALFIMAHCAEARRNNTKQMNELIIDTTLKVYDIAEAFNFTEVKIKSLELLSSYHKLYDQSDSSKVVPEKYFEAISSKLKNIVST